jgi:thiamine-monophosphate kinase
MTTISAIGEFGLIRRFSPPFLKKLPKDLMGIGDDCAVLPWKGRTRLLVTTDMLVEDIHFLRAKIPARDLGYKALAVNLSDIAAMGGRPESAFLSLGIPAEIRVEWLDAFFNGLKYLAAAEGVRLLGGDTTKSPGSLIINIAVIGRADRARIKFRSGAKPGDLVCVTGELGDSGGGLRIILEDRPFDKDERYLVRKHNRPRPHLEEGAWLAGQGGVTAMMDVSDGIDSDLRRIMEKSRCGAAVDFDLLPISAPLRRTSEKRGWNVREVAAAGGEDYCLLAAVRADHLEKIETGFRKRFGRPLAVIGRVTERKTGLRYFAGRLPVKLERRGFDHFG